MDEGGVTWESGTSYVGVAAFLGAPGGGSMGSADEQQAGMTKTSSTSSTGCPDQTGRAGDVGISVHVPKSPSCVLGPSGEFWDRRRGQEDRTSGPTAAGGGRGPYSFTCCEEAWLECSWSKGGWSCPSNGDLPPVHDPGEGRHAEPWRSPSMTSTAEPNVLSAAAKVSGHTVASRVSGSRGPASERVRSAEDGAPYEAPGT